MCDRAVQEGAFANTAEDLSAMQVKTGLYPDEWKTVTEERGCAYRCTDDFNSHGLHLKLKQTSQNPVLQSDPLRTPQ